MTDTETNVETLRLFRASPIGVQAVPQLTIEIHDEMPRFSSLAEAEEIRRRYTQQAEAMAEALFRSLPGGTIDALLGAMLHRKASMFRVPFVTGKTEEPAREHVEHYRIDGDDGD